MDKQIMLNGMRRYHIDEKELIDRPKKKQQKFLILLSNDVTIVDNEWAAMKKARKAGKHIVDMLPTDSRLISQTTVLTKLLESLEIVK